MRRNKSCPLYPNSDRKSGFPQTVMSALPPNPDMKARNAVGHDNRRIWFPDPFD